MRYETLTFFPDLGGGTSILGILDDEAWREPDFADLIEEAALPVVLATDLIAAISGALSWTSQLHYAAISTYSHTLQYSLIDLLPGKTPPASNYTAYTASLSHTSDPS